ncbi:hypothetical protein O3P69_014038 [Scylla paramamosain]|uniref:Uncharacterized protein n=1 Tax=Scylla paramamosain TaxID=85552 RepID=A0AAW0SSQ6_SCYPA
MMVQARAVVFRVVKMVFNMSRWPTAPPRPGNDSNPSNSYVTLYRGRFHAGQVSTRTSSSGFQRPRPPSLDARGFYRGRETPTIPCTCPPACEI